MSFNGALETLHSNFNSILKENYSSYNDIMNLERRDLYMKFEERTIDALDHIKKHKKWHEEVIVSASVNEDLVRTHKT